MIAPRRSLFALGFLAALVVLATTGASARAAGSWNFASRVPAGETVVAAEAGGLTLDLHNRNGTILAGVNGDGSGEAGLGELAAGQALVAWTAPIATGGQDVVGVARSDVVAVDAIFGDGATILLPLNALNAFSNGNAGAQLVALEALDATGSTVGVIAIPPTGPSCGQTVCRALSGAASSTAGSPLYGLFSTPTKAGVFYYGGKTTLSRVNSRTLAPIGKKLALPSYFQPQAFSPDGKYLLGSTYPNELSVIRLAGLGENPAVQSRLRADIGSASIRASAWPAQNRVLVLTQQYSQPYNRNVSARTLMAIDPRNGRVVWRRALAHKLGVFGTQTVGGKLVIQLGDSGLHATKETLVVASPGGRIVSSTVSIPKVQSRIQQAKLVTAAGAAYLVAPSGIVFSIDLDNAQATAHVVAPPANAPKVVPAVSGAIPDAAALGGNIVASGMFTRPSGATRVGVYLIDTTSWTARLVDRSANRFVAAGKQLLTYTSAPFADVIHGRLSEPKGTGIAIYDLHGVRVHHLYGTRKFAGVDVTPKFTVAVAFASSPAVHGKPVSPLNVLGVRLLFDPKTGRSHGHETGPSLFNPRLLAPGFPLDAAD